AHRVIALDRGGTVADHRLARSLRRRCRGGWVCGGRRIGGASGVRRLRVRGGRFGRCRRRGRRFGGRGGRGGGRRCIAPASGQRKGAGGSRGGEFRVHGGSPVEGGRPIIRPGPEAAGERRASAPRPPRAGSRGTWRPAGPLGGRSRAMAPGRFALRFAPPPSVPASMSSLRVVLLLLVIATSTVLHVVPLLAAALVKVAVPARGVRRGCN